MEHPHPHRHRRRRVLLPAVTATATLAAAGLTALSPTPAEAATARQVEKLDRGLVSVHTDSGTLVGWRWLGTDPNDVSCNVYRAGTKVNSAPITGSTNFFHSGAPPRPTTPSARSWAAPSRPTPSTPCSRVRRPYSSGRPA